MLYSLVLCVLLSGALAQFDTPICQDGRSVIVHLFNWRWDDIADECENWLGPKGFCGVQVSPPHEHRVYTSSSANKHRPWWERYQPVSYLLESRSGGRAAFEDMTNRCSAVGVNIYVDLVFNHMTGTDAGSGTGSGGSYFDVSSFTFPDFSESDFNCCDAFGEGNCVDGAKCYSSDCGISNYNNAEEVRDCRLSGLVDLAQHLDYVRETIRGYMQDLIDIGVVGFRVDACKHMWPSHIEALYEGLTLPSGEQPFIFNEVIDLGSEPIKGEEYFSCGRVTEFKYCNHIAEAFRGYYGLNQLVTLGESWDMYPSGNALVFVENHDNQRGHGAGGELILTFYEAYEYKQAVIFTMAWNYGMARILSSYKWPGGRESNGDYGPPTNDGDDIKRVVFNPDDSCDDGSDHSWVCEHRWRMIGNMAAWRNAAGGEGPGIDHWWDNGNNQIAFSRNGAAFIAFNTEGYDMEESLQTGMPAGEYCDIISGNPGESPCSGTTVSVGSDGNAQIFISGGSTDPIVAIHV